MPFIFSRRFIQHCLDALRPVLSASQHAELVADLNRRDTGRLAAMWEAVVLTCFIDQPDFVHEAPLDDGRKPDFQFLLPNSGVPVVGDITSVSDKGSMKDNPIEHLMDDIGRLAAKYGSDLSQFDIRVDATTEGEYRKRKVVLSLPKGPDRHHFLKNELKPYIRERLEKQDYGHKKIFNSGQYHIEVIFQPKSQYASYGYPSFTSILHIDRNPLWSALKDKADQLRAAPAGTLRLVIVCDGGSDAMRDGGLGSSIGRKEIIENFLRRQNGIDIVVSMMVDDERRSLGQPRKAHDWGWFVNETWLQSDTRNPAVAAEVQQIINAFGRQVPDPTSNAQSAMENCLTMDYGIGAWGGYTLAGNTIEISARAIQRVLAGEVTVEEFNRDHRWTNGNRFATALKNGQTISSVAMTRRAESDDDFVEITFASDPSISPFR